MKKTSVSRPVLIGSLLLSAAAAAGCASGGGAASGAASSTPGAPVVLDGARYKLLAAGGSLDGRVVEFLQRGKSVMGCLASTGNKLRGVAGVDTGTWVFSLQEKGGPGEYEGVYRAINPDGSIQEKPVAVGFQGEGLSWNLESATWERQSETSQLTPEEKTRCTKR